MVLVLPVLVWGRYATRRGLPAGCRAGASGATDLRLRSEAVGANDLAAGVGGDGSPGRGADAVLHEPDRPVQEHHVDASRVVRAGADHRLKRVRLVVALPEARLRVRRHDVAVPAPLAAVLPVIRLALAVGGGGVPGEPGGGGAAAGDERGVRILVRIRRTLEGDVRR